MSFTNVLLYAFILLLIMFTASDTYATENLVEPVEAMDDFSEQYDDARLAAEDHYWAPSDGYSESEKDFQAHDNDDGVALVGN